MSNKTRKLEELGYFDYASYLRSVHWLTTRSKFLSTKPHHCEACRRNNLPLHVHHQTYKTLGAEPNSDLCLLCEDCHVEVHALFNLMSDVLSLHETTQRIITEKRVKPEDAPDPEAVVKMRLRKSKVDMENDFYVQRRLLRNRKKKLRKKEHHKSKEIVSWRSWEEKQ